MPTLPKTLKDLLVKIQKAGRSGVTRASLVAKGKVLEKQTALQELENDGLIIQKQNGGVVFIFSSENPPLPASEALTDIVQRACQEKGVVLWKEGDLIKALTKLKYYTAAEAMAAVKALCGGVEMLEVKDGKAKKYVHRSMLPLQNAPHGGNDYFVSESARLIYALVELDGECRQKSLGLTQAHYRDAEFAKQWRNRIAMQIHPDVCRHPMAQAAADELTMMFKEMTV